MRVATLSILAVACSSPATVTPTGPSDEPVARDAAAVAVVPPPDATPVDAAPPCVAYESELRGYAAGAMTLCKTTFSDTMIPTEACATVTADGAVAPAPVPDPSPWVSMYKKRIELCTAVGACERLDPKLTGEQQVVAAAVDGAVLAIGLRDRDAEDSAMEIWDTGTRKRIARTSVAGQLLEVGVIGDAIIVRADHGDEIDVVVWRLTKKRKLDAGLPRMQADAQAWAGIGADRAAFAIGETIRVYDTRTMKLVGSGSWRALVDERYDAALADDDVWIRIAGEGDEVAVYVTDQGGPLLGAGVLVPVTGEVRPYAVRLCPEAT